MRSDNLVAIAALTFLFGSQAAPARAQVPIPFKWVLEPVQLQDSKKGTPLTVFEPIFLTHNVVEAVAEPHGVIFTVRLREIPPQPYTFFVCEAKPTTAHFRVLYDEANAVVKDYYLRPDNALDDDPAVLEREVAFLSEEAWILWDGRAGDGERLIARGNAANYTVTAFGYFCGFPGAGAAGYFTVAKPHAVLVGNEYPQDYTIRLTHKEGDPDLPPCDKTEDFWGVEEHGAHITPRAVTLETLGPEGDGYESRAARNRLRTRCWGYGRQAVSSCGRDTTIRATCCSIPVPGNPQISKGTSSNTPRR
ncbi:MAG: hypothetical protein HYY18_03290 [Planctomycetes bacterium]|nr:hypothetical protein [Planctomycetota bacterium]